MSLDRLRETFRDPALSWILERLRRRLERGRSLTGTITLARPTRHQRAALDRLLGRSPSRGGSLTLRLESLEQVLVHGELAADLEDAVHLLVGPVVDQRSRAARLDERWAALFAALAEPRKRPEVRAWLSERRTRRLARRFSDHDPAAGRRLLGQALDVLSRLPAAGVPLPELAASVTGDSHALDAGRPLGTLVISAAAALGGVDGWHGSDERRDVWASVGVLLDELSAPVLVLNLRAAVRSLTGRVLALHAEAGEPCRLSTRQLLRHPPELEATDTVYVCENPAIVAAAASRLATRSAPLVCVEGQPKTAARLLLDRLARAGVRIAYHGDFDWAGLRIANLVIERHAAVAWRYTTADYRKTRGGKELTGQAVDAVWDPDLRAAMSEARRAVHEEQVVEDLLKDLVR